MSRESKPLSAHFFLESTRKGPRRMPNRRKMATISFMMTALMMTTILKSTTSKATPTGEPELVLSSFATSVVLSTEGGILKEGGHGTKVTARVSE